MLRRIGPAWLEWAFVGAWMGVIFYWSHQVKPGVPGEEIDPLRKSMHVIEYLLLFWLWCRALSARGLRDIQGIVRWALFLTILYSVSDEIHQSFVGRDGSLRDVLIDIACPVVIWVMTAVQRKKVLPHSPRLPEESEARW